MMMMSHMWPMPQGHDADNDGNDNKVTTWPQHDDDNDDDTPMVNAMVIQ